MKVTLILKKSVTRYDTESQATIYARLRDGRQLDLVAPTHLTINPNLWDDKAEQVKSKVICDEAMRTRYNNEVRRLKTYIERAYQNRPEETVSKGWLKEALDQYYNPQKYNLEQVSAIKPTLTALFDEFLEKHRLSSFIGAFILIDCYRHRLQITYKDAGNFFHQHSQRILAGKIITNFRTVSYTHLDVYKRQQQ